MQPGSLNSTEPEPVHIATEGRHIAPIMLAAKSVEELLEKDGAAFITCMYLTILKRAPDATGYFNHYNRFLLTGDRLGIIYDVYRSNEARAIAVSLPGLPDAMSHQRFLHLCGWRLIQKLFTQIRHIAFGQRRRVSDRKARSRKVNLDTEPSTRVLTSRKGGVAEEDRFGPQKLFDGDHQFDLLWYLSAYPDVMSTGIEPLEHYLRFGKADRRFCCKAELIDSVLDVKAYTQGVPCAAMSHLDALDHYIKDGQNTGIVAARLPLTLFDPDWYARHNPDVVAPGFDPLLHYLTAGIVQQRPWTSFKELSLIQPEAPIYSEPPRSPQVKVIAFYRPKSLRAPISIESAAREIPEWERVSSAKPLYAGHDQPKVTGELGFYETGSIEMLVRQAALARVHGLFGFCVYISWSDSRRASETPVELLLRHPDVDINFCYCLTDECKASAGDEADHTESTSQSHSAESDIAFIARVSRAFADQRYIRVDGNPVLAVFRTSQFPDMSATSSRWREWCRSNGIGELHLCSLASLNDADPSRMGLDASIEFPPRSLAPREITRQLKFLKPAFKGHVHDFKFAAKDAGKCEQRAWHRHRGVMPSWDDTPQKMDQSTSFFGATPELYAEWLENAVSETAANPGERDRLVFINAWNDWGEGAYLEPDQRRGYAVLNETRGVIAKYADQVTNDHLLQKRSRRVHPLAVIVHLHYGELFEGMAAYLDNLSASNDLYFSVRDGAFPSMLSLVAARYPTAVVVSYPNRGRDVLPFLRVFSHIQAFGYTAICKIHSKKSRHRQDGDQWRDDVFNKLLGSRSAIDTCLDAIQAGAGVVAPAGHLLAGTHYWGLNAKRVEELALKMGCHREWIDSFVFPAGTMFWFAPAALGPLMALNLASGDFEAERGQVDGTTAHAVERLIGLSARKAGLGVIESSGGSAPCVREAEYPFVTTVRRGN